MPCRDNTHTLSARSRRNREYRQFSFVSSSFARRLRIEELEDRRLLAVFTVTNLNDEAVAAADDAPGTLRQGIFDANALNGSDTIEFAGGLSGTILLTEGVLAISDSATITGPGAAQLTLEAFDPTPEDDNGDGNRVFDIDDGNNGSLSDVVLSGLTLTGGDANNGGGAIRAVENLTVRQSVITGNSTSSTVGFLNVGGGIYTNFGAVLIEASTISNNTVYHDDFSAGGGISVGNGDLTIRNSTISGNRANAQFGVNGGKAYGGGILVGPGTHLIANSTIANNRASAFEDFGGGIAAYGSNADLTINHSIIADNFASSGREISSTAGVTAEFSIVESSAGWLLIDGGGNIFDSDPGLSDELIDHGGLTPMHALIPGSIAIDAGDANTVFVGSDQRGSPFLRQADGDGNGSSIIDIGTYERQTVAGLSLVVDTIADESDGDYDMGDLSLREAVGLANGSIGPDAITFAAELSGQKLVLIKGELRITDSLTIDGHVNTGVVIIDATGNDPTPDTNQGDGSRIFQIQVADNDPALVDVELIGLHLTGGDVTDNGGAIYSRENLTLSNMTIDDNYTTRYGGGVDQGSFDAMLTIEGSTISRNIAAGGTAGPSTRGLTTRGGGGIRVYSSGAQITSSTISGNRTVGNKSLGGGIASFDNDLTIRHSTITDNSTSGVDAFGGNIAFRYGDNFILDHTIVANGSAQSDNDVHSPNDSIMANNSLIEAVTGLTIAGTGNVTGLDPQLGPLTENGGPTQTHAPFAASPAVEGGAFAFTGPPNEDQRGTPFTRIFNGDGDAFTIIDIGAYERQTIAGLSLVVDSAADESDGDYSAGDLSLREAIGLANGSIGSDTITFASDLIGKTIDLVLGELQIVDNVAIDATSLAGKITIDASGNDPTPGAFPAGDGSRVMKIDNGDASTFIDVELIGLTLTGGDMLGNGGAIENNENLTITNGTIVGNAAVALVASGNGSVGAGGGVEVDSGGSLTLNSSTISGNSGDAGGGVAINDGQLTLNSSTISGNSVSSDGGGLWATGATSSMSANHSTIARNHADSVGGGVLADNTGSITLNHTIVADNDAGIFGAGPSDVTSVDPVTFDHGWVETAGRFTATGGVQFIGVDPQLGLLADNGGPTQTHALMSGSPAIEVGNLFFTPPPATDQRGAPFDRVFDANGDTTPRIDIGAYEWQTVAGLNLVVDVTTDETNGNFSAGDLSLREAVSLTNGSVGADTITFAAGLSGATITLVQGQLPILEDVLIDAMPLAQNVIVDASGNDPTPTLDNGDGSRLFLISDKVSTNVINVTLRGLELTGGDVAGSGGAILSFENLTIEASTVRGNVASPGASAGGGGLFASNENLVITDSTISGNRSLGRGRGGGIYLDFSDLTLTNSTVSGNVAGSDGGAIQARGFSNTFAITHSTISGNAASQNDSGGGIHTGTNVSLTVNHTIVANNEAGTGPDIFSPDTISLSYSLVEVASGFTSTGSPNITGQDPLLAPLASNGGPTQTHALMEGSPAIDMGEFGVAGEPTFDQRGAPFDRIVATLGAFEVIDIGAFEVQAASADFDIDGDVDGFDFLAWQRGVGTANAAKADGDADNDTNVDGDDLAIWQNQFGQSATLVAAASTANSNSPALMVQLDEPTLDANWIDAAMALEGMDALASSGNYPLVLDEDDELIIVPQKNALRSNLPGNTSRSSTDATPGHSTEDAVDTELAWLTEELLERVFG